MGELAKRVLTALVGIPLFLLALVGPPANVLAEGSTWLVLVMLVALLGSVEMSSALERRDPALRVNRLLMALSVYLPFEAWLGAQSQASLLPTARLTALGAVLVALGWEVWQAERRQVLSAWRNLGTATLIALYLGLLLGAWVHLRLLDAGCARADRVLSDGVRLVLLGCLSVWACDSVAYLAGSRLGRRRVAPLLSPRKSWEGAGAGVLGGMAAALLCVPLLGIPPLSALALGSAAACAGQVGDLFESALKRELGVKDFGSLLPGHGGVMDRLDSLLFALPVVYLLSHWLPICP
ncbi:MAG: phosphatidate cytidylyltransferase [bacterium]|nr:phosphatidate cytidylyltransferase [bacterium]MCS7310302.1 phosphatidate cytidylyltransferase [Armatimonadota bacterium]MDW8105478.1 phosphatidate cytidylyltransferase [Armatimonadota bacterium]